MAWITLKLEGIDRAKKLCSPRLMSEVLRLTNKEIAKTTKTAITDKIREGYNIKLMDLNKVIKLKSSSSENQAVIEATDTAKRPPGVFQFGGRIAVQTPEGAWVEIRKGKGVKIISQGFIQTMPSGHKGIFIRMRGGSGTGKRGQALKGGRVARLPIHKVYGPRITSLFKDPIIARTIEKKVHEVAQKIFDRILKWKAGGIL